MGALGKDCGGRKDLGKTSAFLGSAEFSPPSPSRPGSLVPPLAGGIRSPSWIAHRILDTLCQALDSECHVGAPFLSTSGSSVLDGHQAHQAPGVGAGRKR